MKPLSATTRQHLVAGDIARVTPVLYTCAITKPGAIFNPGAAGPTLPILIGRLLKEFGTGPVVPKMAADVGRPSAKGP